VRRRAAQPAARRVLLVVGVAAFAVMTVFSFRALPDDLDPDWWLVVPLVLVTTPLTVLANASEYRIIAAVLGHQVTLRSAIRVSLVATIANYLPAPGGVAVRTTALHRAGSTVGAALAVNAAAAIVWVGATGVIAGGALLVAGDLPVVALGCIVGGVAAIASSTAVVIRRGPDGARAYAVRLIAIEAGVVVVSGARAYLSLRAVGVEVSVPAALAISGAAVITAAIGIAPAGLGLREGIAAVIARVVSVPASAAVAASAVDRVASQVGVLLVAVATGFHTKDLVAEANEGSEETDELDDQPVIEPGARTPPP
jgi:uncharacterized membrane protein YbhN (UPF0104 family)